MKKLSDEKIRIISIATLSLLLLFLLLWQWGCSDMGFSVAAVLPGLMGTHLSEQPLTAATAQEYSPTLLQNEIDSRITKIRPMSTPLDQISRFKGARKSGSMIVDYYSVDTKPSEYILEATYTEPSDSAVSANHTKARIKLSNCESIVPSDTLMVLGRGNYGSVISEYSEQYLMLYVLSVDIEAGEVVVMPINGKKIGSYVNCVPSLTKGLKFLRLGRAATELDVQTAQFESLPVKSQNYCQIFKMQIEQSTFFKLANKEIEWDFSDQEELAIYDMRRTMERSFLFGVKQKIYDPVKKEEVSLTGGIWWQVQKKYLFDSGEPFTHENLVDMMKMCFTGNAGNKRKILMAGSELISILSKLDYYRTVSSDSDMMKWGLDFNEISSKFGKLYVIHSEIFDEADMSTQGLIFDPEYIQKWSHVPFGTQSLDLKKAGVRNTDALVLTEASCMTLRYPDAHMRVCGY